MAPQGVSEMRALQIVGMSAGSLKTKCPDRDADQR
jgi:hypothetical protein